MLPRKGVELREVELSVFRLLLVLEQGHLGIDKLQYHMRKYRHWLTGMFKSYKEATISLSKSLSSDSSVVLKI